MKEYTGLMERCIRLASRAVGMTYPNPAVGAIIIDEESSAVISEGWHRKAGGRHAEAIALDKAGRRAKGATLIVSLEPCVHYGRTPPCADRIIRAGIRRVVIAARDPDKRVRGRGIRKLRDAGIEVIEGVLREKAEWLNRGFFKYSRRGLPWISLKIAMGLDGKIADSRGKSKWITSREARKTVHIIRREHDGILIGINTLIKDDPALTVRNKGKERGMTKIILDSKLRTPANAGVFSTPGRVILVTGQETAERNKKKYDELEGKAEIIRVNDSGRGGLNIFEAVKKLGERGLRSVLVEGGGEVFTSFIRGGIVDYYYFFIAPMIIGADGVGFFKDKLMMLDKSIRMNVKRIREIKGEESNILLEAEA